MSDLTGFRDHCRRMVKAHQRRPAEAKLWQLLADEADAYLAGDPDVVQHALYVDDDQLMLGGGELL
jgi:hypothetical protein